MRDQLNYPPKQKGYNCHHIAYPYSAYVGRLAHQLYQHNEALLQPVRADRHNQGYLTVHSLIDPKYGPPPKPRHTLMLDAVDFMQELDPNESRIRRLGHVISFFYDEADWNRSPETAEQAYDIAKHYSMQELIIREGAAAFMTRYESYDRGGK